MARRNSLFSNPSSHSRTFLTTSRPRRPLSQKNIDLPNLLLHFPLGRLSYITTGLYTHGLLSLVLHLILIEHIAAAMPGPVSLAEQVKEVWTSDEGSMAKDTATNRWPKIVQGMVDDVAETAATAVDRAQQEEAVSIQASLKEIKDDMLQNRVLR